MSEKRMQLGDLKVGRGGKPKKYSTNVDNFCTYLDDGAKVLDLDCGEGMMDLDLALWYQGLGGLPNIAGIHRHVPGYKGEAVDVV